jgi:hypothetical protein
MRDTAREAVSAQLRKAATHRRILKLALQLEIQLSDLSVFDTFGSKEDITFSIK